MTAELLSWREQDSADGHLLDRYVGNFLEGFTLTEGADDFEYWRGRIWTKLRTKIERLWIKTLAAAAEAGDWNSVRDQGLQILDVAPEAEQVRVLVMKAWVELEQYDDAEVNYDLLRQELADAGKEPSAEIKEIIQLARRRGSAHSDQALATPRPPGEVALWRLEPREDTECDLPPVDVFVSAAMASTESPHRYELERAQVMLLVEAIRDLGYDHVYFAGEQRPTYGSFEDEGDALTEVCDAVRRARVFVLFYPVKRPSSSLIELGMAMALGKPCLVLVRDRSDLPFLLISPSRHYPPVDVFKYRDIADILRYLRRNLARIAKWSVGSSPPP